MKVNNKNYRTVWLGRNDTVKIIDQTKLPFKFEISSLLMVEEFYSAIKHMQVRGAGCIGATAGYGMYVATKKYNGNYEKIEEAGKFLKSSRPTAVNLEYAVNKQLKALKNAPIEDRIKVAKQTAKLIANEDVESCRKIGEHGLKLIEKIHSEKKKRIDILTHCNAGWLAFVDYGSATAPIYLAHDKGIDVHVWVDETRPRNQGARLTSWELINHGVENTLIADNTGGLLMREGQVDLVIVGADRVARNGDTANKIGTYLKALAAKDNKVPFYVALPSSTFDWNLKNGKNIPIEVRNPNEITEISGLLGGREETVELTHRFATAANYSFDITPSRLITGFITERGICKANEKSILELFPEKLNSFTFS